MRWDKRCKEEGLKIRHFYNKNKLIATLITKKSDKQFLPYGIAVCSKKDYPSKEIGRRIAYERLKKALEINTGSFKRTPKSFYKATGHQLTLWGFIFNDHLREVIQGYNKVRNTNQ